MLAQPVAEDPVPDRLDCIGREDVQVAPRDLVSQAPVLLPPGLADHQLEARGLESWQPQVRPRVRDGQVDVDDRLGRQPRDRGRADVFDCSAASPRAARIRILECGVRRRPRRVRLDDLDAGSGDLPSTKHSCPMASGRHGAG